MPRSSSSIALLSQIAHFHYRVGLSQTEIADLLGLSKMVISRSLRRAFEQEVVTISIKSPVQSVPRLERALSDRFSGITFSVVENDNPKTSAEAIGSAFAHMFLVGDTYGNAIGIGLGFTVASFVRNFTAARLPNRSVVQLIGGLPMAGEANPFSILHELSQKLSAPGFHFAATALVESSDKRDALINHAVRENSAPALWSSLDCAIFGIGRIAAVEPHTALLDSELSNVDDVEELLSSSAVGDLLGHCIDPRGNTVETNLYRRIAAIPESTLKGVPQRIALAGGPEKGEAIAAALRSGFITDLVTDVLGAGAILDTID